MGIGVVRLSSGWGAKSTNYAHLETRLSTSVAEPLLALYNLIA